MDNVYRLTEGKKMFVEYDEYVESPINWDNLCKFIFIGEYSHLGDKHDFHETHESFDAHQKHIENKLDVAFITPIYAYVHSGMTISTEPFSCPWDSGKLGWVVMTKQALRENYGVKRVTKKLIEKAMVHVDGEVKTLDNYIKGNVYWFKIEDENGYEVDSCGGFIGDIEENGMLEYLSKEDREASLEQI